MTLYKLKFGLSQEGRNEFGVAAFLKSCYNPNQLKKRGKNNSRFRMIADKIPFSAFLVRRRSLIKNSTAPLKI